MKHFLTIISALLIVAGLKAQKTNVQKETVKPKADSVIKTGTNKQISNSGSFKFGKTVAADKVAHTSKQAGVEAKVATTTKKVEPGEFKKSATQQ
ncbi:MAG: hypothetical protein IT250_15800 [Chitinophagaceae bacterium]|nr:hypothetical protein [Chitinophagaceae bacterium]